MNRLRPAGSVARTGVVAALAAVGVAAERLRVGGATARTRAERRGHPERRRGDTVVVGGPVDPGLAGARRAGHRAGARQRDHRDRAAAETVFRTYLRAVADGDFATACTLNAPETNQRLLDELARRGTPATSCEAAIAALYAGSGVAQGAASIADTVAVERVDVDGDAATVAWSVEVAGKRAGGHERPAPHRRPVAPAAHPRPHRLIRARPAPTGAGPAGGGVGRSG